MKGWYGNKQQHSLASRGINTKYNELKKKYTLGQCDEYAIALHRKYGYPLYVVRGYFEEYDEDWSSEAHFVVKVGENKYEDVTGIDTAESIIERAIFEIPMDEIKLEPISESEVKAIYNTDEIGIKEALEDIKIIRGEN